LYKKGILKFEKEVKLRAAYHDPCNLSKLNGIYDSPRNLLKSIPGITYILRNIKYYNGVIVAVSVIIFSKT